MTKVTARCQNTCLSLSLSLSLPRSRSLFRSEHPAERAPLCISMHSGGLVARVSVCAACTRVSPVIAARVHALYDLLVRNDDTNARPRQMIYRACRSRLRDPPRTIHLRIVRHF